MESKSEKANGKSTHHLNGKSETSTKVERDKGKFTKQVKAALFEQKTPATATTEVDQQQTTDSEEKVTVKEAVAKLNGSTTHQPKRDLTAPTKSSAAKVKQPTEKSTKTTTNKSETTHKKPERKLSDSKTSTKTYDSSHKEPKKVSVPKDNSCQSSVAKEVKSSETQAEKHTENTCTNGKVDEVKKPDNIETNSTQLNTVESGLCAGFEETSLTNTRSPSRLRDMAACDPQTVEIGLNPQTTDTMILKDGKVKYTHLTYKKVHARMYDYQADVKLVVGKSNFKAHRNLLSEASDYFAAMFSHNMKEKEQSVIELKEISAKGFTEMLDYFYRGYVTVEPDNVEDMLEAARFFHVDWILDICCDFLIHHLSLENYNAVLTLAEKYVLGDLRWEIFTFLGQNLDKLVQDDKFFKTVSYDLLFQFLMENIYIEMQENHVVNMIVKWVQLDPGSRQEHLLSLLRQVKFNIIDTDDLENLPKDVTDIKEIKDAVEQAINYNCNVMAQCLEKGEEYLPRGAQRVITVMSFSVDGNFIVYREPAKSGMTVEQLGDCGLDTVDYHAMSQAKINNYVYAAGGYDDNYSSTGRTFRFEPKYREWIEVAPMNQSRVSFGMCSSDKHLFALGGVDRVQADDDNSQETMLNTAEMYEPTENSWINLPSLPLHCYDTAPAYINNRVYVCGGISTDPDTTCPLGTMWCLDLDNTDQGWMPRKDMLTPRQGHSLVPHKGKLYAQGGYTMHDFTLRDCFANEVYDIETDQWSTLTATPEEFGHLYRHSSVLDDAIFVLGGQTAEEVFLYLYEIDNDLWEQMEIIGPNVQKLTVLDVAYPPS